MFQELQVLNVLRVKIELASRHTTRRNEIEGPFGRIERFCRVFTRDDASDLMFTPFITVVLIADLLR